MRRIIFILLAFACVSLYAQKTVVSGVVVSGRGSSGVEGATVKVAGSTVSVVTNADGRFTLKTDSTAGDLVVSHLGFRTQRVTLGSQNKTNLVVRLQPATVQLREVVVTNEDPRSLVDAAIRQIPKNYSREPELFSCFYRETTMKRQHYIGVAEGVADLYKTSYTHGTGRDRVAIRKGRRLLSPRRSDTLSVKVMGGPVQAALLDVVKNTPMLLNAEELDCYSMTMENPQSIADRMQFVVAIAPLRTMPWPLYYGRLYIDQETLAFTRIELNLDMADREKATQVMLVKKPLGVRFRPKELSLLVDYRYEDGVMRLGYIRTTFRFNCDWRRRLFATSFTAQCELVTTDRATGAVQPITGRESFDSRDAFFDKVEFFLDPDFWQDYNIIEPTTSLDRAIGRLLKKMPDSNSR